MHHLHCQPTNTNALVNQCRYLIIAPSPVPTIEPSLPPAPTPPAPDDTYSFSTASTSMSTSAKSTSTSTSVKSLMKKHLPSSNLHSPRDTPPPIHFPPELWNTKVGETFQSLEHNLKESIRVNAENVYRFFVDKFKVGTTKARLYKIWEDKLKKVDTA